jgi:hypothetical protein
MEDEYETLCADSAENCKTIAEWVFNKEAEYVFHDGASFVLGMQIGKTYRRKKPSKDVLLTDVDDISRGIIAGVVQFRGKNPQTDWITAFSEDCIEINLQLGNEYRLKPGRTLPPKKVKKLVDWTTEELTNFIGVAFFRNNTRKDVFRLLNDNLFANQEQYEISLDRGKTWCPMQKTVEIDA